jgi:hypothetical protein
MFETGQPIGELPLCSRVLGSLVPVFPWGDLSSRCTRGNGLLDTEDLDGDLLLNQGTPLLNENVFRYVVDLAADEYFVREGNRTDPDAQGRTAVWKLYRVPIRLAGRGDQHRRSAWLSTGSPSPPCRTTASRTSWPARAMARFRFRGSPWTRRAETRSSVRRRRGPAARAVSVR